MKPVKQAKRYAKALLRNVGMENAPQALTELISVNDLMVRSREFRSLLINPRFTTEEKAGVIKTISERLKLSESTLKFVLHVSEVGVIAALSDIIRVATNLYLEKKKKAKANDNVHVMTGNEKQLARHGELLSAMLPLRANWLTTATQKHV